jgi:hypothetical protein
MLTRRAATLLLIPVILLASGCNALTTAQNFENVITGILNIAKAEIPSLPPADGAILAQWSGLLTTLNGQLQTCITSAGSSAKKATFLACFNAFAVGATNPTELAQLRLLSPGSQQKVELWLTAAILGVNAALEAFGGAQQIPPVITSQIPSKGDLNALARQLNLAYGF